jgi:glycosyltransferase involved in cell wall biosynthesis
MSNIERNVYPRFNFVLTVSEKDLSELKISSPNSNLNKIGISVSDEYFLGNKGKIIDESKFKGILLTGSLDHPIIAFDIINFLDSNLDLFISELIVFKIYVLGKNPHPVLVDYINKYDNYIFHLDYVPDYIEFLNQDWIYVYCQQCGSGLQTKLQQAMALGLPTIGYQVAYDGIEAKSELNCFIVDSFNEMGNHVINLYDNPQLRFLIGLNASKHVYNNFNIEKVTFDFVNYLKI